MGAQRIPVENFTDLFRDSHSKGIININSMQFQKYKKSKSVSMAKDAELEELKSKFTDMENKLDKILKLLDE